MGGGAGVMGDGGGRLAKFGDGGGLRKVNRSGFIVPSTREQPASIA